MTEYDILMERQNIHCPLLHILSGVDPSTPGIYLKWCNHAHSLNQDVFYLCQGGYSVATVCVCLSAG